VRAVFLGRDLIIGSRIADAAVRAGADLSRCDSVADLPGAAQVDVLLVDWAAREPEWGPELAAWRDAAGHAAPRIIVFGPHTDLEAHAAARAVGIGPMVARSKLIAILPTLF
jgi:hypothetical protein